MESKAVKPFSCSLCKRSYKLNYQLRTHVKKKHPSAQLEEVAPTTMKRADKYPCGECDKKFNFVKYLNQHKRQAHSESNPEPMQYKICPVCDCNIIRTEFINHLTSVHNLTIDSEDLSFSAFSDFEVWKSEFEMNSKAQFRKSAEYNIAQGLKRMLYICNRNGIFRSTSKGIRNLKKQGSRRIGASCPAGMKVTINNTDGSCTVHVTKTHVGHAHQLEHLDLSYSEKKLVAAKIALGVPIRRILEDARGSIRNCELQRTHLLTRKDILNIKTSFNLQSPAIKQEADTGMEANEVNTPVEQLGHENSHITSPLLDKLKEHLIQDFTHTVRNLRSIAELDAVKQIVTTIDPTVKAMRNCTRANKIPTANCNNIPFRKKIKKQKTKKENKKRHLTVAKSPQEENEAAATLLLSLQ